MKLRLSLYITVVVLLNIAATTLFFRIDMTENKTYSLSHVSKNLVKNLEEPLTIKVYLSENLPVPYNTMERDIRDILIEYDMAANRHFNYSIDIIKKDDSSESSPEDYNIYPVKIQNIEQDEMQVVSAYLGIVLIHGDMMETIPAIDYNQNLELLLTDKIRSITEKTSTLLGMKDDITTTLYLSPILYELSTELKLYNSRLRSEVDRLNEDFYHRVSYNFVEPTASDVVSILEQYPSQNLKVEDEDGNITTAIAAVVVESGSESSVIEILKSDIFGRTVMSDHIEVSNAIKSSINKLIATEQRIGYLTSHGTIPMEQNQLAMLQGQQEPSINNLLSILYEDYAVSQIDLNDGYIRDDIKTLIIARPQEKFSERELFLLDQFLMKGNSVLLAIDQISLDMEASNLQYGQEVYRLIDHGLTELLSSYGITLGESIIMDENSFTQLQRASNGGVEETKIYFAPQIKSSSINSELNLLKGVNELLTFRMSSVTPADDSSLETLFYSSEKSWEQGISGLTMNPERIFPSSNQDSYPLAVMKSGGFTSYFTNRKVPAIETVEAEESDDEVLTVDSVSGSEQVINSSNDAKLVVLGSSDMLTDQLLTGNSPSNLLLIRNIIDSISDREAYTAMRSKGVLHRPMDDISDAERSFMKFFNIVGIPLLVLLSGLITWYLWIKRKRRIMQMFLEGDNNE